MIRPSETLTHLLWVPGRTKTPSSPPSELHRPEDLRLLAPHHVGRRVGLVAQADQTGNQPQQAGPRQAGTVTMPRARSSKLAGQGDIGRLAPALPAADHAGGEDHRPRPAREPSLPNSVWNTAA